MEYFKKTKDAYIRFNKNHEPLYAFLYKEYANYTDIIKYIQFCNQTPDYIAFPQVSVQPTVISTQDVLNSFQDHSNGLTTYEIFQGYLNGGIKIRSDCFNIDKPLNLLMPHVSTSVTFDDDFNISATPATIYLPDNYSLFKVDSSHLDSNRESHNETWPLIANYQCELSIADLIDSCSSRRVSEFKTQLSSIVSKNNFTSYLSDEPNM